MQPDGRPEVSQTPTPRGVAGGPLRPPGTRSRSPLPVALGGAVALALAGCAAGPNSAAESRSVNTGLNALGSGEGGAVLLPAPDPLALPTTDAQKLALTSQAALDIEAILSARATPPAASPAPSRLTPPTTPTTPDDAPISVGLGTHDATLDAAPIATTAAIEGPVLPDPAPPGVPSGDPLTEMATRMARLIREPAPGTGPIPDAVALAAVEAVGPGALADLDSAASALGTALAPDDRKTLIAARDRWLAAPAATNDQVAKSLAGLSPAPSLRIARATLCTKVMGFGKYEPYPSDTFLVGRPLRAIVYVEVDGFASRPAREGDPVQRGLGIGDQVSVELTQAITLYQDPSGLLAWHRPARAVVETSRNTRRDFYLIQQIELPSTLTIGRYNLKVTVADRTTGAETEAILPVNLVADPTLLTRRNGRDDPRGSSGPG